jgi:hypothetical protein
MRSQPASPSRHLGAKASPLRRAGYRLQGHGSAARKPATALRLRRDVVELIMVVEERLVRLRKLFALGLDVGRLANREDCLALIL